MLYLLFEIFGFISKKNRNNRLFSLKLRPSLGQIMNNFNSIRDIRDNYYSIALNTNIEEKYVIKCLQTNQKIE